MQKIEVTRCPEQENTSAERAVCAIIGGILTVIYLAMPIIERAVLGL